jgi:hypothetical protein
MTHIYSQYDIGNSAPTQHQIAAQKKQTKTQHDSKHRRLQPSNTNTTLKYKYIYYHIPILEQYQNIAHITI